MQTPIFFFSRSPHHRDLHSFPTRRSSDLAESIHFRRKKRPRCKNKKPSPSNAGSNKPKQPANPTLSIRRESHANELDRKSTRLNSSHRCISYAVFCLKKKKTKKIDHIYNR